MKKEFSYIIVYVFGPEQCEEKYFNDEILTRDAGEWVKIGETGYDGKLDDITREDMKCKAMVRIKQESRTGIPVPSKIYDLFIFPYRKNTDEQIRNRLCDDLFDIESSKRINKCITNDDSLIPAGREFVYGVCRSNIKYAVQSFDHDLIVNAEDEKTIRDYITICKLNDIDMEQNSQVEDKTVLVKRKPNLDIDLILEVDDEIILINSNGDIVKDENGNEIKAKYIGNKKFECRGEIARTSPLAKKYLNMCNNMNLTNVNGNDYWTFEGKRLSSLRKN